MNMLRRILSIALRDLKSGIRDFMVLFILVMPILLAVLLKSFVPSVGAAVLHAVVPEGTDPAFVDMLERHGRVETVAGRDALVRRVAAKDDVVGFVESAGETEILVGGNEAQGVPELAESVAVLWRNRDLDLPVTVAVSDVGWLLSPLMRFGADFLLVFISVFGGMVVMLNLVEEKQSNTLSAVNVTPVRRWEYIAGKGLLGFVLPMVNAFAILLVLGFTGVDFLMVSLVILSIALIGLIVGFAIGIHSDNQMTAVASMKMMFLPIFGSILGGIFLAEKWHPLLYWSPFYWAFRSMDAIVLDQAAWSDILVNSGIILLLTAVVFLSMWKRIRRGFD